MLPAQGRLGAAAGSETSWKAPCCFHTLLAALLDLQRPRHLRPQIQCFARQFVCEAQPTLKLAGKKPSTGTGLGYRQKVAEALKAVCEAKDAVRDFTRSILAVAGVSDDLYGIFAEFESQEAD